MDNVNIQRQLDLASVGSIEATLFLCEYYINNNEYIKAFQIVDRLKNSNNIQIIKKLAHLYEKGIGIERDEDKANKYYELGFNNGDASCGFNLALFYFNKKEYDKCLTYLYSGASNNHIQSLIMLSDFYYKGIVVVKDAEVAVNFYKKLVDLGENKFAYNIGKAYYEMQNYGQAYKYLSISHNLGDIRSLPYIADCYLLGLGTNQNIAKAVELLQTGSDKNDYKCLIKLSKIYENGVGVERNVNYAQELINQAKNVKNKLTEMKEI